MEFKKFVSTYLGRRTDWDGCYGVQCVDLIDSYIEKVLDLKVAFFGNAKTWWTNRNDKWIREHFEIVVPKYKNGELKAGDIGIRTSGTWGHIFIIKEPAANGRFKYYDQNATGCGDCMTLRDKPYNSACINGVLRPKAQNKIAPTPKAPIVKLGEYTLTNVRGVYKGYGDKSGRKKVKELTTDGKRSATSTNKSADAYLKAGTIVSILETKLLSSGNLWAKIPSGCICIWEHDIDKKFIK